MNKKEMAKKEVIKLLLRYDLLEDRAIAWRRDHGIVLKPIIPKKEKFYFYYEGDYDYISESIFAPSHCVDTIKRKIRILMKRYPNLKCCLAKTKCCGSDLKNIEENNNIYYCGNCSHEFNIDKNMLNMRVMAKKGHTLRHMNVIRMKELRMPAVMIWESI